jgi:hypothetical protein
MINRDEGSIYDAMRDGIQADQRNYEKIVAKDPNKAAQVGAYVKQEFPKTVFGVDGSIQVVQTQQELTQLGPDFYESPDQAKQAAGQKQQAAEAKKPSKS